MNFETRRHVSFVVLIVAQLIEMLANRRRTPASLSRLRGVGWRQWPQAKDFEEPIGWRVAVSARAMKSAFLIYFLAEISWQLGHFATNGRWQD